MASFRGIHVVTFQTLNLLWLPVLLCGVIMHTRGTGIYLKPLWCKGPVAAATSVVTVPRLLMATFAYYKHKKCTFNYHNDNEQCSATHQIGFYYHSYVKVPIGSLG